MTQTGPFWLPESPARFPPTHLAAREPSGLLAVGGDLTPEWLLEAYRHGIFPWFNADEPVLWWTPDPRCVLMTDQVKIRRSLRKVMKKSGWRVSFDTQFDRVIRACAETPRPGQEGTWLSERMIHAYTTLHSLGYAHSVEVWWEDELVGGLYGVSLGKVFFGESMFSWRPDASKIALVRLAQQLQAWGFRMIDCQVPTDHLMSMGATLLPRAEFERILNEDLNQIFPARKWHDITTPG